MTLDYRHATEDDREAIDALRLHAFNRKPGPHGVVSPPPIDEFRVLHASGRIRAALRVSRVGQFFGGRSVPAAAFASVMVAGDARGRGLGNMLLREALVELSPGVPLAVLHPTTLPPYRKLGCEQAGVRTVFRSRVDAVPGDRDSAVEEWGDDDLDAVAECYESFAATHDGLIDRPAAWWEQRVLHSAGDDPMYRYLVRSGRGVCGYVLHTQPDAPDDLPFHHDVVCHDLVWTNAQAASSLLAYIAADRALANHVTWIGPVNEPLTTFFRDLDARPHQSTHWMMRLVDVATALEARGFAPDVEGAVELSVSDPVLESNAGAYRLEVSGGACRVTPIDRAEATLDVSTLAAIYTGWLRPSDAVRTGRMRGADASTVLTLDRLFRGPVPWMIDRF